MIGFYLVLIVFVFLLAYAGVDNTMRLFAYLDLELRYRWTRVRMYPLRRKLEKSIGVPVTPFIAHVFPKEKPHNG